MDMQCTART